MSSVHFSKANISSQNVLHGEKIKVREKAFHGSNYDKKVLSGGQRKRAIICKIEHTFGRPKLWLILK